MQIDKGLEKIGDLLKFKKQKPPAYAWQDLALRVIKELGIPDFKKSAVFKVCKQNSYSKILLALNDTKELCKQGESWRYFFKVIEGNDKLVKQLKIHG